MKRIITLFLVSLMCIVMANVNVLADTDVVVKEITQDTKKIYIEFEGDRAASYVRSLTTGDPNNAYIELTGKFLGYVRRGTNDYNTPGIYRENETKISIEKSEMINGNFPNETYTFNFYEEVNGNSQLLCSKSDVLLEGLKDKASLHYLEAKTLEVTGVKIPVAGEQISDSLDNANVKAIFEDGTTKTDLLEKEYVHLNWVELDPNSPHIMYEEVGKFLRLDAMPNEQGFVHLKVKPFTSNSSTIVITIGEEEPYTFTTANNSLEYRGDMNGTEVFDLKISEEFLNDLKNTDGTKDLTVSDGNLDHTISIEDYSFLYHRKDLEGDVFKENTPYELCVDYKYLKADTSTSYTPRANTKVSFGYRTFKNNGGMGFGDNVICVCLGLAEYNAVFQTTTVGQPTITDIDDIRFNASAVSELTSIISKMINDNYYDADNELSILREAINKGGNVSVDTSLTKLTEVPEKIEDYGDDEVLGAVDIEIFVKVDNSTPFKISELSDEVSFEYAIPGGAKEDTTYYVLREHEGVVDKIEGTVVNNAVVFKTDKFSTYALIAHKTSTTPSNPGSSPRPGYKVVPNTGVK